MTTAADPSISSEPQPNATLAIAARVARVSLRLLLVAVMLLPVFGLLKLDGRLAGPLAILGLFSITLVRPEDGLLLCAAFLPIGGPPGTLLGFYVPLREPSVLAFLAGWLLRETVHPEPANDSTTRAILLPAWLLAAVVAASTLVQLAAYQPFEDFPWPYVGRVIRQLAGSYVFGDSYPGLAAGAAMLEGIGLFAAVVVLCRRRPELATKVARMASVGAGAVAALNLSRLVAIWLRGGVTPAAVVMHARDLRITSTFPDVNAAGSYLAMMLFVVAGLAVAGRRMRWAALSVALLVLAATWITGSTTAWAAVAISGAVLIGWIGGRKAHAPWKVVLSAAVIGVAALGLVVAVTIHNERFDPFVWSFSLRGGLWQGAVRAFAAHPVFGVGIGRYLSVSSDYLSAATRLHHPSENAHNQYLQFLAELGLPGLVPFLWVLAAIGRRVLTKMRAGKAGLLAGSAAGILAFLLTCFFGHPLLVGEVALAFWLVLGLTAALAAGPERGNPRPRKGSPVVAQEPRTAAGAPHFTLPSRRRQWLLVAAILALAVSIPVRVHQFIEKEADLEQAAIGFSKWQFDDQGVRYRTMKGRGEFHVAGAVCGIRVGLRVDPAEKTREVDVELSIDGEVANRVRVIPDAWNNLSVLLPIHSGKRFRTVDLRTTGNGGVAVQTGRPALRYCQTNPF